MRAVLMAGGSGTRLRPLTCDLPKPMVPILNRPIAEHIINLLKRHQIYEVIATLHYYLIVHKGHNEFQFLSFIVVHAIWHGLMRKVFRIYGLK
jgi:dTDP-glucose pyrophosphorylase